MIIAAIIWAACMALNLFYIARNVRPLFSIVGAIVVFLSVFLAPAMTTWLCILSLFYANDDMTNVQMRNGDHYAYCRKCGHAHIMKECEHSTFSACKQCGEVAAFREK